jgi:hypothetical protein
MYFALFIDYYIDIGLGLAKRRERHSCPVNNQSNFIMNVNFVIYIMENSIDSQMFQNRLTLSGIILIQ